MRNTITGAMLVGGAVVALGLGFASAAHGDGSLGDHSGTAFAAELNAAAPNDGLPDITADQATNMAKVVCVVRQGGSSEAATITKMTDPPKSPHQYAVALVTGAEYHFCPEYRGAA